MMPEAITNAEIQEDTQKNKYLTFKVENEDYGIEIRYVTEIIGVQPITSIPELPCYIKGVINLRGKIIPVMDVRLRFRKPEMVYNNRTCIIVIDISGLSIGLIVDRVSEVLTIMEEDIVESVIPAAQNTNTFLKGIGKVNQEVKLLLECEQLLSSDELEVCSGLTE